MRLIIDSKIIRVEICNVAAVNDNGSELEVYSDPCCSDPMYILIGGYWGLAYSDSFMIDKRHLQTVEAIYLVPDELRKDEEANDGKNSTSNI